ncbi:hypothetical protein [Spongiactinospora sp. TRM90649]|uniref:hypothetical protein n=1 Tax=Spongiactinospora sp. TRM90649 TaxID=3031114 RepID=UPI0023F6251F|nr:hypothetical protein [Spongiactinospora sp. TRM90649]MDF5754290.1 hypothetical protein [Spongiactinospora sp. TRM90649]
MISPPTLPETVRTRTGRTIHREGAEGPGPGRACGAGAPNRRDLGPPGAGLLGLCERPGFDGEAVARLEAGAATWSRVDPLAWRVERRDGMWVYDATATIDDLPRARAGGEPPGR